MKQARLNRQAVICALCVTACVWAAGLRAEERRETNRPNPSQVEAGFFEPLTTWTMQLAYAQLFAYDTTLEGVKLEGGKID